MTKRKSSAMQFAVCINNEDYPASLQVGKLYRVLPDEDAAATGMIRVVDEDGEDYGYEAKCFFPVELPPALVRELRRVY